MEAFLVYGLVLLFFLLIAVFTYTVLKEHPYTEPEPHVAVATSKAIKKTGNIVAYIVIAGLFLLFCIITVLDNRESRSTGLLS